jgi:hypothetical protein
LNWQKLSHPTAQADIRGGCTGFANSPMRLYETRSGEEAERRKACRRAILARIFF